MAGILQGEMLRVENIKIPVLVVSKDFFNQTEQIIGCPVVKEAEPDPLHIPIRTKDLDGIVLCEQMKFFDLHIRGYKKIAELDMDTVIDITDAIQSIFDYYPFGK